MILIDATYIHSYGGLNILRALIMSLNKNSIDHKQYNFLVDNRVNIDDIPKLSDFKSIIIEGNHINRKRTYQKIIYKYDVVVCLANVPPPIKVNIKVYVYFHNLLLLNRNLFLTSLMSNITNYLKFNYIKFFNTKSYNWVVQTEYSKNLISKKLNIEKNNIKVLPIYFLDDIIRVKKNFNEKKINFLCVTSNSKHKNIKKMIKAFCKSNFDMDKKIELFITTEGENKSMDNKRITYLGYVDRKTLIDKYSKSHYIVFPSLIESFGLPIVEGIASGANIISSDIESIKEIAKPSLKFNPKKLSEIKIAFENSAKHIYNSNSKLTIKNEINNFIKLINNNV